MDSAHTHITVYVLSLTHASLVAVPSLSKKAGNSPVTGSFMAMGWQSHAEKTEKTEKMRCDYAIVHIGKWY